MPKKECLWRWKSGQNIEKALGITQANSTELENLILQSAESGEATKEQETEFGRIFRIENDVAGINQVEILCTLWIVLEGDDIPYLTSCFIKTRKGKT